jgi:hypothetical protein
MARRWRWCPPTTTAWRAGRRATDAGGDLFYVYRVYDRDGQFDETAPQELTVVDTPFEGNPPPRPLFGSRDEAAVRNIPFGRTATVTVTGHADAGAEVVRVGGQMIRSSPTAGSSASRSSRAMRGRCG